MGPRGRQSGGAELLYGPIAPRRQSTSRTPDLVAEILEPLQGISWSPTDFDQAVIDQFNARLHEFPPHYDYLDAISWGRKKGWIQNHVKTRRARQLSPDGSESEVEVAMTTVSVLLPS